MTRIQSLKILILVVFSLLSKIQAQDEECGCPVDVDCNFNDACECLEGYEGNHCEINICTLPNAYHCEANPDICIKPENICDGNKVDCPGWAEDEKKCWVECPELWILKHIWHCKTFTHRYFVVNFSKFVSNAVSSIAWKIKFSKDLNGKHNLW